MTDEVLGVPVTDPQPLGGSRRSTLPAFAGLLGTWGASAAPVGPYRAFARGSGLH